MNKKGLCNGERHPDNGAILLEYVFLLVVISLEMLLFGNRFYTASEGLGNVGLVLQAAWQRIVTYIMLPIP